MSDNKFEKQVQQKLDELKMQPSPGAWQGIEQELRGKKRRGVPLWLAAGLLLLAGATYSWYVSFNNHPVTTIALKEKNNFNKNTTQPEAGKENKTIKEEEKLVQQELVAPETSFPLKGKALSIPGNNPGRKENLLKTKKNISSAIEKNYAGEDFPAVEKENEFSIPSGNGKENEKELTKKKTAYSLKHKNAYPVKPSVKGKEQLTVKENKPALSSPENTAHFPAARFPAGITDNNDEVYAQLHPYSPVYRQIPTQNNTGLPSIPMLGILADAAKNDNTPVAGINKAPAPKSKHSAKAWEYGITGGVGISYINEGSGLSLTKSMVEDVAMASNTVSNSQLIPGPTLALYTPAIIKPSLSYSLGVALKRTLSKRLAVSAGLSYVQYNARTEVGNKIDASQVVNNGPAGYLRVETYYLNAQVQEYKNRYHFIYLPVSAHLQLNRGDKLPVYLNAGMALSKLISSNSLHFDGATGVYYSNNDLINKTQFDVSSGISVVLFNRHSAPLWLGPAFRYNISPLLQKDVSGAKRLVYAGLDLKMFLRR
ncbi:MAG: outer membrane beta-barrel protein [Flavitalea sp.]